jgi:hypothetical protein
MLTHASTGIPTLEKKYTIEPSNTPIPPTVTGTVARTYAIGINRKKYPIATLPGKLRAIA